MGCIPIGLFLTSKWSPLALSWENRIIISDPSSPRVTLRPRHFLSWDLPQKLIVSCAGGTSPTPKPGVGQGRIAPVSGRGAVTPKVRRYLAGAAAGGVRRLHSEGMTTPRGAVARVAPHARFWPGFQQLPLLSNHSACNLWAAAEPRPRLQSPN